MGKVSDELVERLMQLARDLHADHVKYNMHDCVQDFVARTAAIVAELPEPVDPDLIEARVIAASTIGVKDASFAAGFHDRSQLVVSTLAGIKRGKQLAGEGR